MKSENKTEQTSFKQLVIEGNLLTLEYGVVIIEVTKGIHSFYYAINAVSSLSELPLLHRFIMHLKYISGGKNILFNRLMMALKIKSEKEMTKWLSDATIKFLFYKTSDYVEASLRQSNSKHMEKVREADIFLEILLKELSVKYKKSQILNYQVKREKKQKPVVDNIVNEMIKMIGGKKG